MRQKRRGKNSNIRYSEAFKVEIVRELERKDLSYAEVKRKYGIRGSGTVQGWAREYGNGSRGKVIRVEKLNEINETKRLRERVKQLEKVVADTHIELALERSYTKLACQAAGMEVETFKKKADTRQRVRR